MKFSEAGCVFMGFILYISGVQGRANSICALKGSSVDLPCSAEHPTSSMQWFTVQGNDSVFVLKELSADGNHVMYNMSEESNFTLTINGLRESDEKLYCCTENPDQPALCWHNRTQLQAADLQVKVIPTTEGQTVTLMCSTSCPLTEEPAAYIWYKNREFLYEDWSPWYQQLVSSEEAVRYSCAIKGDEDLRAPEVSVDSVTSSCFSVTYAKGRMCSYIQKSEDEPCSVTYPRELHLQKTPVRDHVITVTCNTSCPIADPQTAYRWYMGTQLHSHCDNQHITLVHSSTELLNCAIKGHEDLHSDEDCYDHKHCLSVNYVTRRICALEGSSVNISSKYSYTSTYYNKWSKVKRQNDEDAEILTEIAGHLEYHDNQVNSQHMLRINNLMKNDSAEYIFRHQRDHKKMRPGVTLVVTGLKMTFTPSAMVTEGQRVTLTCSTSCPLPDDTNYTWYVNGRPLALPENQHKHLVLDPVSSPHAGNYSCAVDTPQNISSSEEALIVIARHKSVMIVNAVRLAVLSLIPPAVFLFYLMMRNWHDMTIIKSRRKKIQTSAANLSCKGQTGQMDPLYDSIALVAMNPAAEAEPAELQEDTV